MDCNGFGNGGLPMGWAPFNQESNRKEQGKWNGPWDHMSTRWILDSSLLERSGFQGTYTGFQLRCTPDVPWAQIDKARFRVECRA